MRNGWHIVREGACLTVARAWPVRWDRSAEARFPDAGRRALAQQIRQDMWRRLHRLRGFRPSVAVTREATGLQVRAGGAVSGRVPASAPSDLHELLHDPTHRRRWLANARRRG